MKAFVVLCVALVVSGHPHVFHGTPVVKRVHETLPEQVRMLPLPSYAAPQVITLEQPQHHYTPQHPVVHEQPYGYGLRMPEEEVVTPCPKHHFIFANSAPVRIRFGNDVTGPHTHGPGHIASRLFKQDVHVNSHGSQSPPLSPHMSYSAHGVISNAHPQERPSDGNAEESSDMIVHNFLRPSMAAAHDLGTARSMISGMTSGRAQASGTVQISNLLNEAHRRGSQDVPQVPGRVPVETNIRNRQVIERSEFMEEARPHIPILRFEEEIIEGHRHSVDFDSANGIHQGDKTTVEHVPGGPGECDKAIVKKTGSFSYIAPDGQRITTTYVADENGYRVRGDHLPTPPPIPEAIQRSLDELRSKGRL